jgi:hypothetical protein
MTPDRKEMVAMHGTATGRIPDEEIGIPRRRCKWTHLKKVKFFSSSATVSFSIAALVYGVLISCYGRYIFTVAFRDAGLSASCSHNIKAHICASNQWPSTTQRDDNVFCTNPDKIHIILHIYEHKT